MPKVNLYFATLVIFSSLAAPSKGVAEIQGSMTTEQPQ
jgi:hypothetical protein